MTEGAQNERKRLSDAVLDVMDGSFSRDAAGLLLIDMPTGYGKSYAARQFLARIALDPERTGKAAFYVTNQKKNLPTRDEMVDMFRKEGAANPEAEVEKRVIWVKSVVDMMEEGATWELFDEVPPHLQDRRLKDLITAADSYRAAKSAPGVEPGFLEYAEKRLRGAERAFRIHIEAALAAPDADEEWGRPKGKAKPLNQRQKLARLRHDADWMWLADLYPTVFTREKQVFLMSFSKFLVPHVSIVDPPYKFMDDPVTEGAVVLIDEFDSSKDVYMDVIVEEALRGEADPVLLLRQIHKALEDDGFPKDVIAAAANPKGKDTLSNMKDVIFDVYEGCGLAYNFKSSDDPSWQDFIFFDYEYHSASGDTYHVAFDEHGRNNRIVRSKNALEDPRLSHVLGRVRGALNYAKRKIHLIAQEYQQLQNAKRGPDDPEYGLECALRTVLDVFNIKDEASREYMMSGASPSRKGGKDALRSAVKADNSVYERGYHYTHLVNSEEHRERTEMRVCAMQDTPERALSRLCERAYVIGLSATCTYDSPLCNYDLQYLQSRLGERFKTLADDDICRMVRAFAAQNAGYGDVDIVVDVVDDKTLTWAGVFGSDLVGREMEKCAASGELERAEYRAKRYLHLCYAYKAFLGDDGIRSMLCLTMAAPKAGGGLDPEVISTLFCEIEAIDCLMAGSPEPRGRYELISGSAGFEQEYEKIRVRLEAGEKVFICAAYNTLGTGVNLQYRVPEGFETVCVYGGAWQNPPMKDIDAIFLDRPTNTAPYLSEAIRDEKGLLVEIFRMCELKERMEVSEEEYLRSMRAMLRYRSTGKKVGVPMPKGLKERPSARLAATKYINQAVGRICRTNRKSPTIRIMADAELAKIMCLETGGKALVNREYAKLTEALEGYRADAEEAFGYHLEDGAAMKSNRMNKRIGEAVERGFWSAESMVWWKEMRKAVLRHPVLPDPGDDAFVSRNYAIAPLAINAYSYDESNDYAKVGKVCFEDPSRLAKTVSAEAARLPQMMEIPGVAAYFEKMGWATDFEKGTYILTPVLFNNIYKGALGEVVGKYVLEQHLSGVLLDDIEDPAKFEKFDYVVRGTDIYVDFKHWQAAYTQDAQSAISHIRQKMAKTGASKVLVVNIFGCESDGYRCMVTTDGEIMTVPYLFDAEGNRLNFEALAMVGEFVRSGRQL